MHIQEGLREIEHDVLVRNAYVRSTTSHDEDELRTLSTHKNPVVRTRAVSNCHSVFSYQEILQLAKDTEENVRCAVLTKKGVTVGILDVVWNAEKKTSLTDVAIARHPCTPTHYMRELFTKHSAHLNMCLCWNASTPPDIIRAICEWARVHNDSIVTDIAKHRIKKENGTP